MKSILNFSVMIKFIKKRWNRYRKNDTIFPNIEKCTGLRNCAVYFPQFSQIRKTDFFNTLRRVIEDDEKDKEDSYFKNYKNYAELLEIYKKAENMEFYEAVQLVYSQKDGFIRGEIYFGLRGGFYKLNPCCA